MRRFYRAAFWVLVAAVVWQSGCKSGPVAQAPRTGGTHLLNGRNLDSFYTVLDGQETNDDSDKVFSLSDGTLRISGQHYGFLATKKEYANYKLVAEFKWGDVTWAPRQFKARESGILINASDDGAKSPATVECKVIEGSTGSLVITDGSTLSVGGVIQGPQARRIDRSARNPWKDQLGFRGTNEIENPHGEWNTLEIIYAGGEVGVALNGQKILTGSNAKPEGGRILLRSRGAEIFFRRLDVYPIK